MNELKEKYFNWIKTLVAMPDRKGYDMLLHYLFETPFEYILPMDENRYEDGIDLRFRFGYDCGYDYSYISDELDKDPCSVLEMMAALALRCEENLMDDPDIGNRTGQWFWSMVDSMRLSDNDDAHFDILRVQISVDDMLNRTYSYDGEGGLFTNRDTTIDQRDIEIWDQAMAYMSRQLRNS